MSRVPRNTVQDRIVDSLLAILPDHNFATVTITQVCGHSGVNRSSFYQYFEDMTDLEERFLHLYFHRYMGSGRFSPTTMVELVCHYQRLVEAMRASPAFFAAVKKQPRLLLYQERWKTLLEANLRKYFRRPGLLEDRLLWNLHIEFSLAVVNCYCDLGFQGTSGFELPALTRWMVEFQIGGLCRFNEKSEHGLEASNPAMDSQLSERREKEDESIRRSERRRVRDENYVGPDRRRSAPVEAGTVAL